MVIYFSGNGNSKAIAVSIAKTLQCECIALEGELLINPEQKEIYCEDNIIVWVFPVYSWGVPPVVVNFIEKCRTKTAGNCVHHLVVSCGDDTGLTAQQWRKEINKKGWETGSATSIVMPNTYVLMKGFDTDSKELEYAERTICMDKKPSHLPLVYQIRNVTEAVPQHRSLHLVRQMCQTMPYGKHNNSKWAPQVGQSLRTVPAMLPPMPC